MLRKAEQKDIARIAEIIVFTKRVTYRDIFKNDYVSFNVIQVLSEAKRLELPNKLDNMYVYDDDGIIKAVITADISKDNIFLSDFYVEPCFQNLGIGKYITNIFIKQAKQEKKRLLLGVLDKNTAAVKFYEKVGFKYSGTKNEYENSGFYILQYEFAGL